MSATAATTPLTVLPRLSLERPPTSEDVDALSLQLAHHVSHLEEAKNLALSVDNALGRKNAVAECLRLTVSACRRHRSSLTRVRFFLELNRRRLVADQTFPKLVMVLPRRQSFNRMGCRSPESSRWYSWLEEISYLPSTN